MQAIAGSFPRADAAPTQPQGRSGKYCVVSARKRSMLEVEMGGVWGGEAFLRPKYNCTGSASPRADAAPTQPQGRSWKHCVASAHGRSTPRSENGRFWGGEAILRSFLHRSFLRPAAWHRTVYCTVFYRIYSKVRCDNHGSTP